MVRIIYLILSIILISSCNVLEKSVDFDQSGDSSMVSNVIDTDRDGVPDKIDDCPDTPQDVNVDIYGCPLDSDEDGIPDYKDRCPDYYSPDTEDGCMRVSVESSKLIVIKEKEEVRVFSGFTSAPTAKPSGFIYPEEIVEDLSDNNIEVVDKTNSSESSEGYIAYNVPNEMVVGGEYRIKVRITKDTTKSSKINLVIGERKVKIYESDVDSKVNIESIRIEKTMSASLEGDDESFKIISRSTDIQNIENKGYTEWSWLVTPLKSGNNYLKLVVKVKIVNENGTFKKDIVVFDKNIKVKSNIKYTIKTWLNKYWQWLISTIVIPIFIWFYKKRKDKKED